MSSTSTKVAKTAKTAKKHNFFLISQPKVEFAQFPYYRLRGVVVSLQGEVLGNLVHNSVVLLFLLDGGQVGGRQIEDDVLDRVEAVEVADREVGLQPDHSEDEAEHDEEVEEPALGFVYH